MVQPGAFLQKSWLWEKGFVIPEPEGPALPSAVYEYTQMHLTGYAHRWLLSPAAVLLECSA